MPLTEVVQSRCIVSSGSTCWRAGFRIRTLERLKLKKYIYISLSLSLSLLCAQPSHRSIHNSWVLVQQFLSKLHGSSEPTLQSFPQTQSPIIFPKTCFLCWKGVDLSAGETVRGIDRSKKLYQRRGQTGTPHPQAWCLTMRRILLIWMDCSLTLAGSKLPKVKNAQSAQGDCWGQGQWLLRGNECVLFAQYLTLLHVCTLIPFLLLL